MECEIKYIGVLLLLLNFSILIHIYVSGSLITYTETISPHNGEIIKVSWSPNGSIISTISGFYEQPYSQNESQVYSYEQRYWNASNGKELLINKNLTHDVCPWISWSPEGTRIAGIINNTLIIWDAITLNKQIGITDYSGTTNYKWSPDGIKIASIDNGSNNIIIWNTTSGEELITVQTDSKNLSEFTWSPDSNYIAGVILNEVSIFNISSGDEIFIFSNHTDRIKCIDWSSNAEEIISGTEKGEIKIWNSITGNVTFHDVLINHLSERIKWSPDSSMFAVSGTFGDVTVYNNIDRMKLVTYEADNAGLQIYDFAWSPDNARIASGSRDQMLRIWTWGMGGIDISTQNSSKSVYPGLNITFNIALINTGGILEEIVLTNSTLPNGWICYFQPYNPILTPNETRYVYLNVHVPMYASADSKMPININASIKNYPNIYDKISIEVIVQGRNLTLTHKSPPIIYIEPGNSSKCRIIITNNDGPNNTVDISFKRFPKDWQVDIPISSFSLTLKQSIQFNITIIAPLNATLGDEVEVIVIATFREGNIRADTLSFTAFVIEYNFNATSYLDKTLCIARDSINVIIEINNIGWRSNFTVKNLELPQGWSISINDTELFLDTKAEGNVTFPIFIPVSALSGAYNISFEIIGAQNSVILKEAIEVEALPDNDGDGIPDILDNDIDGDGWNNTIELEEGTDPYDPLSHPREGADDDDNPPSDGKKDSDGDGWNNTIETQIGTDPYDPLSVPPDMDGDGIPDVIDDDRDGDGFPNWEDAYPDDGERWDEDVEAGGRWLWLVVGILLVLMVAGVVAGAVMVGRKKREGKGEDREKDVDGGGEDELGRVGKGGDEGGDAQKFSRR